MSTVSRVATLAALCLTLPACGPSVPRVHNVKIPERSTRPTPPPGIDTNASAVGTDARPFALPSRDGNFSLSSQLATSGVVLVFYRGHWCPHCRKQLVALQAHAAAIQQRGALLVAVSADTPDATAATVSALRLRFPVLSDVNRVAIRAYGVEDAENKIAWPATFVIARSGKIVWRSLSDTYPNRPTPEQVLGALQKLEVSLPNP